MEQAQPSGEVDAAAEAVAGLNLDQGPEAGGPCFANHACHQPASIAAARLGVSTALYGRRCIAEARVCPLVQCFQRWVLDLVAGAQQ